MTFSKRQILSFLIKLIPSFLLLFGTAFAEPQWDKLSPTPTLPPPKQSGYAPINGIKIWYATFGQGKPVILLHGGLANSNYWGDLVPVLAKNYSVVVMDSRGHGRSTRDDKPYSFDLMASDVIGLMNFLKIKQAAIVGWSDGAILGLDIAINNPDRVTKLFAFAPNSTPDAISPELTNSKVNNIYMKRANAEYTKLSATPAQYQGLVDRQNKMWSTQPNLAKDQLSKITVPTWVVDGDHDQAIKRSDIEFIAASIPNARLMILPGVGHFAFLQDPNQFNYSVQHFLESTE